MANKTEQKLLMEYGGKVAQALLTIFDEDSEYYIDKNEADLTILFHAISTTAPNVLFNRLTGDNKNNLEFNQLMNQLVFQYSNRTSENTD